MYGVEKLICFEVVRTQKERKREAGDNYPRDSSWGTTVSNSVSPQKFSGTLKFTPPAGDQINNTYFFGGTIHVLTLLCFQCNLLRNNNETYISVFWNFSFLLLHCFSTVLKPCTFKVISTWDSCLVFFNILCLWQVLP